MKPGLRIRLRDAFRLLRAGRFRAALDALLARRRQAPAGGGPGVGGPGQDDRAAHGDDVTHGQGSEGGDGRGRDDGRVVDAGGHRAGRFVSGRFRHGMLARHYKLYIPSGLAPDGEAATSLVVMLHGCRQDPDDFAAGTRMNARADEAGFVVLYPQQSAMANPHRCWNWFLPVNRQRMLGEAALIAALAEQVRAQHGIDPGRVHAAGLSAGGAMAAVLATCFPDRFAAVAVHSGVAAWRTASAAAALAIMKHGPDMTDGPDARHEPDVGEHRSGAEGPLAHSAPMIVFQGRDDTIVHPDNAAALVADLAGRRPVHVEHDRTADGRPVTRSICCDADGRVVIECWLVDGLGHAWSGGNPAGSYTDPHGPDATAVLLHFFDRARPRSR